MKAFNLALLAKQGWRLLQDQDSLCSRVLKANYYPNSSFLDAQRGHNPSYVWSSILAGRNILKKGLCWRVGNGLSVSVWNDKWIPTPVDGRIETPMGLHSPSLKVAELIDQTVHWWNKEKIEDIFSPSDVSAIISIPLHGLRHQDSLMWTKGIHGFFAVKSAYWLAKQTYPRTLESTPRGWQSLWKLQVPNKVKYFLWRLCHDGVATRENLVKRGMPIDSTCPLCGMGEETSLHLFRDCCATAELWSKCDFASMPLSLPMTSMKSWMFAMLDILEPNDMAKVSGILYNIWLARNNLIFRNSHWLPMQIIICASKLHNDFTACCNFRTRTLPQQDRTRAWSAPQRGWFKVNVDGSWNAHDSTAGIGFIIRDEKGIIKLSGFKRVPFAGGVVMSEALAFMFGASMAVAHNFMPFELEGDAAIIVSGLRDVQLPRSPFGHILEDLKEILSEFPHCINYIPRELNRIADALASLGRLAPTNSECIMLNAVPETLSSLYVSDCNFDNS